MKFQGKLPPGHGLGLAARRLAAKQPVVAMVVLRAKQRVEDFEKDETELVAKVARIEVILPDDLPVAEDLIRRSLEFRTGETVLPYELEKVLKAVFDAAELDPEERDDAAQPELPLAEPQAADDGTVAAACDHCGRTVHRDEDSWWADAEGSTDCPDNKEASFHTVDGLS